MATVTTIFTASEARALSRRWKLNSFIKAIGAKLAASEEVSNLAALPASVTSSDNAIRIVLVVSYELDGEPYRFEVGEVGPNPAAALHTLLNGLADHVVGHIAAVEFLHISNLTKGFELEGVA